MGSTIKNFSEFQSLNEGDSFWSNFTGAIGGGIKNVAVGQLTDAMVSKLGIDPNSFGATVVRNAVQTLDLSEYPDFITGNITVRDLAPKMADATFATLSDMGVEGIAARLLKMDPNKKQGLIYKLIKELISNQASKNDFRETLVSFWTWALGGGSSSSSASRQESPFGMIKAQAGVGSEENQSSSPQPFQAQGGQNSANSWEDILSMLGTGPTRSGMGSTTGQ